MAVPLGLRVKEKSSWKTLKLPEDLLNEDEFSGLVDIQELTDYELVPYDDEEHAEEYRESNKTRKRKRQVAGPGLLEQETEHISNRKQRKTKDSVDETFEVVDKSKFSKKSEPKKKSINEKAKPRDDSESTLRQVSSKTVQLVTGDDDDMNLTSQTDGLEALKSNKSKKSKRRKKKKKNLESAVGSVVESRPKKDGKGVNMDKSHGPETGEDEELSTEEPDSEEVDMSEWSNLFVPDEILKALQELKFANPTAIQKLALPSAIRDRKDILGAAETGSGKTLAFGIPVLSRILDLKRSTLQSEEENSDADSENSVQPEKKKPPTKRGPLALILEPTRELAVQVRKHLVAVAKYTHIRFANVVGGMSIEKQRRILGKSPEVVIATPGRLWQLIEEGNEHLSQVDRIHCFVVDEADRMVEKGHYEELTKLLELINKSTRREKMRQTFVMSATLTMDISAPKRLKNKGKKPPKEEDKIQSLIETICSSGKPKVIDLTPVEKVAQTLTELRINCKAPEKDYYLYYFLCQHPGRTLVFVNSKDCLRRLITVFTLLQCSPLPLHADMHQRQRLKNLDRFSENRQALLVASDVAARGLDIPNVDHVIHYQVPRTMENYVHRSGRTARAANVGLSVMLVGPEDAKDYRKIVHGVRNGEELPLLPIEIDLMPSVKQRVSMAREVDVKEYRVKKKKIKNNFFIKAAEEMDMIIDDRRLLEDLGDNVEQAESRQELTRMKARLSQMLQGPLAPPRLTKYPTKSGKLTAKSVVNLFSVR